MNGSAYELAGDDSIDEGAAAFDVECLAGDAEGIEELLGCNGYGHVGVGQQVAVRVVDGDDALADAAGSVGDDGGGCELDVSVPDVVGLGVPDDLDGLSGASVPISGSSK